MKSIRSCDNLEGPRSRNPSIRLDMHSLTTIDMPLCSNGDELSCRDDVALSEQAPCPRARLKHISGGEVFCFSID
ncbi:UNVERIFIED_CONTAM: hypothetical protein Sradi_3023600 [Sesamum radiatum]|uniref:Uncharacterized protein n=1 Tax=Sesamum radiatum TaxID=300843 RepID=A0AAW2S1H4_SESRA